jgi:hypothetical protein
MSETNTVSPDALCKERLRQRNEGGKHPYQVDEATFDLFTSYFVPPTPDEGFNIVVHAPDVRLR